MSGHPKRPAAGPCPPLGTALASLTRIAREKALILSVQKCALFYARRYGPPPLILDAPRVKPVRIQREILYRLEKLRCLVAAAAIPPAAKPQPPAHTAHGR